MEPTVTDLFELPSPLPTVEKNEVLAEGEKIRVERIISTGQTTPVGEWYDQAQDEWVTLLQGEAELNFAEGKRHCLNSIRRARWHKNSQAKLRWLLGGTSGIGLAPAQRFVAEGAYVINIGYRLHFWSG